MKPSYRYLPFDKFLFRTPMYSIELGKRVMHSNVEMWKHIVENSLTQEAIFLSSNSLYDEILKQKGLPNDRVLLAVVRYFSRMFMRSTPFGLFAGCSLGEWGDETEIVLSKSIKRMTRMDMVYLYEVSQYISKLETVKNDLVVYPNNTIYRNTSNHYRYIEFYYQKGKRQHRISQFECDEILDYVLKISRNGITVKDLKNKKISDDIDQLDWDDYIEDILRSQILLNDLTPIVTGEDFFNKILLKIGCGNCNESFVELKNLKDISDFLGKLGNDSKYNLELYNLIIEKIDELNIHYDPKYLFQVDYVRLVKNAELSKGICTQIQEGIEMLINFSCKESPVDLDNFKKSFLERYEMQAVPLLKALDPEIGIGYPVGQQYKTGCDIINNLNLPKNEQDIEYTSFRINALQKLLLKKMAHGDCSFKEVVIEDEDLKKLNTKKDNLPVTLSVMCSLINRHDEGTYVVLQSIGGSCAANLLSRFAYLDNKINSLISDITNKENESYGDNFAVAEIAHSPEARVGNILQRPHLRNYEIPYLVATASEKVSTIILSDIMIEIKDSNIRLFSKTLNKNIIPKLTSAHNFKNNPTPIYRFLCDMQFVNENRTLSFSWGGLGNVLDYFPRVRYKNIILSLARWRISVSELNSFINIKKMFVDWDKLHAWRNKNHINDSSILVDGDNKLYIDWNNSLSVLSFFKIVHRRDIIFIEELFDDSDNSIITDGVGRYRNEFIIPFYKV